MFEYHCWIRISEHCSGEGENIDSIAKAIQDKIHKLDLTAIVKMKPVNGIYFIDFSGATNHRTATEIDELFELYYYISKEAIGSYGLFYTWNDEDELFHNQFKVYKMAKGIITEEVDPFLSPCNRIIEC